jgi:hypothetical protein
VIIDNNLKARNDRKTLLRGSIVCPDGVVTGRSGGGQFLARPEYAEIAPRNIFPTPLNPVDRVSAQSS